eukprot:2104066-Pyramimonas_sp.AAC.1
MEVPGGPVRRPIPCASPSLPPPRAWPCQPQQTLRQLLDTEYASKGGRLLLIKTPERIAAPILRYLKDELPKVFGSARNSPALCPR